MSTILDQMIATKQREVLKAKQQRPLAALEHEIAAAANPVRDFFRAVSSDAGISLIAEVKKASPSAGIIRKDFAPSLIAAAYAAGGAACISVLTDEAYFMGHLRYLAEVRQQVSLPVLRKDFLIDAYQIWEARAAGADAVLLIAECLDDCGLRGLHNLAIELGMTPLVEIHDAENIARVIDAGATLVGINNRDLRTFQTDLNHTLTLRERLPADCTVVSESGIRQHADLVRLWNAGVDAVLVGEHIMAQPDIERATRELLTGTSSAPFQGLNSGLTVWAKCRIRILYFLYGVVLLGFAASVSNPISAVTCPPSSTIE